MAFGYPADTIHMDSMNYMNSKGGGASQDLGNLGTFEALTRLKFNENCLLGPACSYSLLGPKSTVKCVYSRVFLPLKIGFGIRES